MGGTAVVQCPAELLPIAQRRLGELERRWSRFRADSEVSQLNSAQGHPVRVHRDTVRLLQFATQAVRETDGAFNPTLLRPLVMAGYDTSRSGDGRRTTLPMDSPMTGDLEGIMLGPDHGDEYRSVAVPKGTLIDPGGIGKGLAADLVAEELLAAGAPGAMVNVGGDLRVVGDGPHGPGWRIAIESPDGEDTLSSVVLMNGGVATSSTKKRVWMANGQPMHHLLDPSRGQPADNGVVGCTVISAAAVWSEVFTKVAFAESVEETLATYDGRGLAAMLVLASGEQRYSATWKEYDR